MTCKICRCTDEHACPAGCTWIVPGICSTCHYAAIAMARVTMANTARMIELQLDHSEQTGKIFDKRMQRRLLKYTDELADQAERAMLREARPRIKPSKQLQEQAIDDREL